jgi:lantibiotic biosynthesis protein
LSTAHAAGGLAGAIATRLTHPSDAPAQVTDTAWWRQSLAHGAPGIALLHIERAATGLAPWQPAHDWLTHAAAAPMTTGPDSHLFYGAPALAHALACAAAHQPGRYGRGLDTLDQAITEDAHRRVGVAHQRIDRGDFPALAEFDLIRGLTGVGRYLLRRDPGGRAVRGVLEYLVRLSRPITVDGDPMPGWWTTSGPSGRISRRFIAGHGNCGVAHGIAGPLALLALATRDGVTVDGDREAIGRICAWLDRWCTTTNTGPVWPYWVNRDHLRAGYRDTSDRQPPSWCYGTAGLARAQQLAALATDDTNRRDHAEHAMLQALSSSTQRAAVTGHSLCHGHAGLAHIATTMAADAPPALAEQLRALVPGLLDTVQSNDTDPTLTADRLVRSRETGLGLLEGAAGTALGVLASDAGALPRTGWDTCLLIT